MSTDLERDEFFSQVELLIGYRFDNADLLLEAVTHRSYHNENPDQGGHNERLEFLGDAVLDLVVADSLMRLHPFAAEGQLTRLRASMVNEASLAHLARGLEIDSVIRLGKGEEKNNGREKPSILSDALEAVVGAIYLDGGYRAARDALEAWLAQALVEAGEENSYEDAKSALQERLQAVGKGPGTYRVVWSSGPDHERVFEVEFEAGGVALGRGRGHSKKEAEKEAARAALERLSREDAE